MNKIVTAVSKIMADVGSVKKDGENKFHNYKYATASDILHKLQPLLAREGLVIFQNEMQREMIADGAALAITYEFVLAHKDGETWPDKPRHTGIAAARNAKGGFDDKSGNKCHTAARKYFMLALFQIPTGDYDDADEQEDRPEQSKVKPSQVKPAPVQAPVDPTTGEASPHVIKADNDMQWGGSFVAAIKAAKTGQEVEQWIKVNKTKLDDLQDSAPKIYDRLTANIDDKRAQFDPVAA